MKNEMVQKIQKLNGVMYSNKSMKRSHLICENTNSNTMLTAFVASGNWVLTPDYIHMSYNANRFLGVSNFSISLK